MATSINALSVLVVDPDTRCRDYTCVTLQGFGVHDVTGCGESCEALDHVSQGSIDVIFVDATIAPTDGISLVKQIRSFDYRNRVVPPVIFMIGEWSERNVTEARAAGANEFISKPLSAIDLMGHLMSMIDRPQHFIRTQTYFGPDRRNRVNPTFDGIDRRDSDGAERSEADASRQLRHTVSSRTSSKAS